MTQDDRMETITDRAAIRATDEPDERGDFPCCTTPAPVAGAGLDLDAVEAEFLRQCGGCDAGLMVGCTCSQRDFRPTMLALVAEVRRLTRLGQCDLDLLMRAEAAEAEVVTLRAKVAAVEAHPVVLELAEERTRQAAKHGDQSHLPDGTGAALWLSMDDDYIRRHGIRRDNLAAWAKARTDEASQASGDGSITFEHILTEEWAEAIAESDPDALRAELVQVAAVAVQWVEAIDLRAALAVTTGEGQ